MSASLPQHTVTLRDAVVAMIRATFPAEIVPTIAFHDGPADRDFIERYTTRTPSIVVTILGGETVPTGGTLHDKLQFGLYIITSGRRQDQRTNAALAIRQRLLRLIFSADWTCQLRHKSPSKIESANVYERKLDEMGMALWLMSWETMLEIPAIEAFESLDDFRRLWGEIHRPGEAPDEVETGTALAEQQIDLEGGA